jgi:hypothetical protein
MASHKEIPNLILFTVIAAPEVVLKICKRMAKMEE